MAEKRTFFCSSPVDGHKVLSEGVWQYLKAMLVAGHKMQIVVQPAKRNLEQNALLHATLDDVSKTCEWQGQQLPMEVWKRLFMAAWLRERGDNAQLFHALDGNGVDVVYAKTSELTVAEMSELTEFVNCWRANNDLP